MTKKKKGLGTNPLDAIIPATIAEAGEEAVNGRRAPAKERFSAYIASNLLDRARNATYWTPGATMNALVEEAVRREVERREKEKGEAFPARPTALRGGRPVR